MKAYGWFGLLLLLASEYCLFRKIEPVLSWFYCFAWWSYILLADNLLLRLRGRSLLTTRRSELWAMLPLSIFIWLLFEGYNLVIRNWAYAGVTAALWLRWPGYALAFATVLPGIFITSDLIEYFLFGGDGGSFASESETLTSAPDSEISGYYVLFGLFLSFAPLVWPRIFFPTVWIGPILLLDPVLERLGLQSLSLSIAAGNRRRIWSLLMGGMACGLIWEFWNFWAPSRWIYTVPLFGHWKVFEMPLLGFLGFPPFALECWILYWLFARLQQRLEPAPVRAALWMAIVMICLVLFYGIDQNTVVRFVEALHGSRAIWL